MSQYNILLVDDEAQERQRFAEILEKTGNYRVSTLPGTNGLFQRIRRDRPDLLILDIQLKGGAEGLAVASDLKASFKKLPILFLTSHAEYELLGLERGDEFVCKQGLSSGVFRKRVSRELDKLPPRTSAALPGKWMINGSGRKLEIDQDRTVKLDGRVIHLEPGACGILLRLLSTNEPVVIDGYSREDGTWNPIDAEVRKVYVSRLRHAIGKQAIILNRGRPSRYRFNGNRLSI